MTDEHLPRPHTTHFDDCGCLSARYLAEIAGLKTTLRIERQTDRATVEALVSASAERDILQADLANAKRYLAAGRELWLLASEKLEQAEDERDAARRVIEAAIAQMNRETEAWRSREGGNA